ncbi:isopentenyl-diphosphate Delta-isomerase [Actinoplanes sp. NPDC051470]|uniref:isopentenyl-diphosphate Delta-isomerase n=1 Tax=Actinoplanes sp. NPDC051470 TaxID=3157224 RepID=UPI00341A3066
MNRESHLVELVDADGAAIGSMTVDEAHRAPGQLHRAFSVLLRDPDGRVLLQQRAAVKTRFPLRWGNTACGHPGPGEDLVDAAARRLEEEIGISGVTLSVVGVYPYYAEDPASGRVEYEYDHVLIGTVPAAVPTGPDPAEVAALRWAPADELRDQVAADSRTYVPWLRGVLGVAADAPAPDSPAPDFPAPPMSSVPSAPQGMRGGDG